MKKYSFNPEEVIPHFVHVAFSVAAIVLSCEILKKLHRVHRGIEKINEGRHEIAEGHREILGREKKR